eukprot:359588-Chlamydomonas_euryale.AAC.1
MGGEDCGRQRCTAAAHSVLCWIACLHQPGAGRSIWGGKAQGGEGGKQRKRQDAWPHLSASQMGCLYPPGRQANCLITHALPPAAWPAHHPHPAPFPLRAQTLPPPKAGPPGRRTPPRYPSLPLPLPLFTQILSGARSPFRPKLLLDKRDARVHVSLELSDLTRSPRARVAGLQLPAPPRALCAPDDVEELLPMLLLQDKDAAFRAAAAGGGAAAGAAAG